MLFSPMPPSSQRTYRIFILSLVSVLVLPLFVSPAHALDDDMEELGDQIEILTQLDTILTKQREKGFVFMPLAFSNPTLGWAIGAGARLYYEVDEPSEPSHTTLGAFWAGSDGYILAGSQRTFLFEDRFRLDGVFGYFNVNVPLYGIGYDAGRRAEYINLDEIGFGFRPEFLIRVSEHLYMGIRYRLMKMKVESTGETSSGGLVPVPEQPVDFRSSGLGFVLDLDSTDSEFNPYEGDDLEITSLVDTQALGSDLKYQTLDIRYDHFEQIASSQVLAFRASGCYAHGEVPFYDLCLYGFDNNLRGYVAGQYRDKAMLTAQVEYRARLWKRWGLVAFGGVGAIAPDIDEFDLDQLLPSVGTGIRYMVSGKQRINLGADIAVGRESYAFYFRVGEAF